MPFPPKWYNVRVRGFTPLALLVDFLLIENIKWKSPYLVPRNLIISKASKSARGGLLVVDYSN